MALFAVVLFALVVYRLRFCSNEILDCLDRRCNKAIRGICTLVIILHHFSQSFSETSILSLLFNNVGYFAVAIFFSLLDMDL